MEPAVKLPLENFKEGNFYQIKAQDAKRLAQRMFQLYDKDASKTITQREIKAILREIYKNFQPKIKLSNEDFEGYFNLINKKGNKTIKEEDFKKMIEQYYVTYSKEGSLDKQTVRPEIYQLDVKMDQNNNLTEENLIKQLLEESEKRFGKEFTEYQQKKCKKLFDDFNLDKNEKIEYIELYKVFDHIYQKINFLRKNEQIDRDDIVSLLKSIDYNKNDKVGYVEFEIFYFKSFLGS